ncbi:MAG: SH3-like domain-containing protein [Bacteroidetes bacterium]|nr:SH3-like domain-containing protein [Bacteroidota bacterium]
MRWLISSILLLTSLQLFAAEEIYHFTVDSKVRSLPNATADVVANAKANENLTYLKTMESGSWAKIKYDSKIGYVELANIAEGKYMAKVKKASITKYHVSVYETHMYAKKDAGSAKLKSYSENDMVDVIADEGDWLKVQDGTNIGYILASHLALGKPKEKVKEVTYKSYEITKGQVKMYAKPDANSNVLSQHYKGDVVTVVSETKDGKWARCQLASGFGYIPLDAVQEVAEEPASAGGGGSGGEHADKIGTSKNPKKIGAVCRDGKMLKGSNHDVCAKHNGVMYWIYNGEE